MRRIRKSFLLVLLILTLLVFVSGCSNNGESSVDEGVVSTEVETLAELNQAFSSDTPLITLVNDIVVGLNEEALIEGRGSDLILDLNGNTLDGSLNIGAASTPSSLNTTAASNNWNLEIISSVLGGSITGDLVINDFNVIIDEESKLLVEGEIQDSRPSVSGTISGIVDVEGLDKVVLVALVSNDNLEISSFDELEIVAQTYADVIDGSYVINGVPTGSYYVVAYQEVNGSDELEFIEIEGREGIYYEAVEPSGAYGDLADNPLQILVDGSRNDINIPLAMESNIYDLTINVFDPFIGENGENIATADVSIYGKEDVLVRSGQTDSSGNVTLNDLYGGYYYVEVVANGYHDTFTPINPIISSDSVIYSGGMPVELNTVVFTNETLKEIYGLASGDSLNNCGYFLVAIDADEEELAGQSIAISPTGGSIGYMPLPMSDNPQLDFSLLGFPAAVDVNEDTYIGGIKGITPGNYKVGLATDPLEERLEIEIENDRFIYFEPLKYNISG